MYSQTQKINFICIKFTSICCGPPPSTEMDNFIQIFKKDNKINCIDGFKYCCDQEGEFAYYLNISSFNEKKKKEIIDGIKLTYKNFYSYEAKKIKKSSGGMLLYYYNNIKQIPKYMNSRLEINTF